jgi:hypothetical protein
MNLPSLGTVIEAARGVLRRFPLVIAAAVVAALAAGLTNDDIGPAWMHDRLLAAATLGIPLSIALKLFAEQRRWPLGARAVLGGVAVAALAGVWAAWPHWSDPVRFTRYAQLTVAFHLLVAFLPFAALDRPGAFWQYNRTLFMRALASAASSATLFAGLALALVALDKLFGVDVPEAGYFRLWSVIAFVVSTWTFLGGVPEDFEALEQRTDYPAGLRVFAQYTLLPLVSVYLVILTLYLGKVVVTWDWPSGWIGWLVSGVAAGGILALLLVHPLAGRDDQKWVGLFARDFWRAILPAVVMLWLALYQRVHQYGITEPRYVLLLLSLWLFGVALWYVVTHSKGIRLIPASLCAVALLSYAGPWGAAAVSERSQMGRLRALLVKTGALAGDSLRSPRQPVAAADAREISAVVRYLVTHHGAERLAPWVGDSLAQRAAAGRGIGSERMVVRALGFDYAAGWAGGGAEAFFFNVASHGALPAAGYDVLLRLRSPDDSVAGPDELKAMLDGKRNVVRVTRGVELIIEVPLDSMLRRLRDLPGSRGMGNTAASLLSAAADNGRAKAVVYLRQLNGQVKGAGMEITAWKGDVLLTQRPPARR